MLRRNLLSASIIISITIFIFIGNALETVKASSTSAATTFRLFETNIPREHLEKLQAKIQEAKQYIERVNQGGTCSIKSNG